MKKITVLFTLLMAQATTSAPQLATSDGEAPEEIFLEEDNNSVIDEGGNNMDKTEFMRLAIAKAREGIATGQSPFGACIVKDGEVISCEHNVVWKTTDITAHAEINAIRVACTKLNTIDLSGCTIYSTCEPCPMCFSACHWARMANVICGASIDDADSAGFHELTISCEKMVQLGKSEVKIEKDFLNAECVVLFDEWKKNGGNGY